MSFLYFVISLEKVDISLFLYFVIIKCECWCWKNSVILLCWATCFSLRVVWLWNHATLMMCLDGTIFWDSSWFMRIWIKQLQDMILCFAYFEGSFWQAIIISKVLFLRIHINMHCLIPCFARPYKVACFLLWEPFQHHIEIFEGILSQYRNLGTVWRITLLENFLKVVLNWIIFN